MHYHLILTDECNLSCRYCRGRAFDEPGVSALDEIDLSMPSEFGLDPIHLYRFLEKDPEPVVIFYGGEPLLRPDLIRSVMEGPDHVRYILYTNGILLNRLSDALAKRLDIIHVSIDGPEPLTDYNRGPGTYRKVISNLQGLSFSGFSGEIIARMTVGEGTDILEAVLYLTDNDEFPFESIHWQIDADFSGDFRSRDFKTWLDGCYNPGISKLVTIWVDAMKCGKVRKWYPFMETTADLLLGRECGLRCGAGYANYAIMPDGNIGPCPVMVGMKEYVLGTITDTHPLELRQVRFRDGCSGCDILDFCGGRCMYSQVTRSWPPEGRKLICDSVHHLHRTLSGILPEVRDLLQSGMIQMSDLIRKRFNGCEIIP